MNLVNAFAKATKQPNLSKFILNSEKQAEESPICYEERNKKAELAKKSNLYYDDECRKEGIPVDGDGEDSEFAGEDDPELQAIAKALGDNTDKDKNSGKSLKGNNLNLPAD